MLSVNQMRLLVHLKQYGVANQETCFKFLDDYKLRPLIRNKYISHHHDLYRLLKKGLEQTAHIQPLVTISGNAKVIERALHTSYIAALFAEMGIGSSGILLDHTFIPSNKWREIRGGIISTTRFHGMLIRNHVRLAVYYIGDGTMEWQAFAEGSLFFRNYGSCETQATGMLLICDRDAGGIAEKIIRYTMWNRKSLIKDGYQFESDKRRAYSTAPIRLRSTYHKVYISSADDLKKTMEMIENEYVFVDYFMSYFKGSKGEMNKYDIEAYPIRYVINPQGDLLKFVRFFDMIKAAKKFEKEQHAVYANLPKVSYYLLTSKKYERIAKMYNDLLFDIKIMKNSIVEGILNGTHQ